MRREYERHRCPFCNRTIASYVPHCGDGSDVKLVAHNYYADSRGGGKCLGSDRMLYEMLDSLQRKPVARD